MRAMWTPLFQSDFSKKQKATLLRAALVFIYRFRIKSGGYLSAFTIFIVLVLLP
jgi:hypothetical protein